MVDAKPLRLLALVAGFLLVVCAPVVLGYMQFLSDSNFEHLTQASSGSTTGPWLVMFYPGTTAGPNEASMHSIWTKAADVLAGRVNVAKVDLSRSPGLQQRFSLTKDSAHILYIRAKKVYNYPDTQGIKSGNGDTEVIAETIAKWATQDFVHQIGTAVPDPPSIGLTALTSLRPSWLALLAVATVVAFAASFFLAGAGKVDKVD